MNLPVLVVFFNREEPVIELISRISEVKPKKLYLACDGPRDQVAGEENLVIQLRSKVLQLVDWECEIFTSFQSINLGCKHNVSGAVKWFFENENKGIILEDDCIPSIYFFEFAEVMLEFYENDYRVGSISGRNEVSDRYKCSQPYFFSRKFFCWGWASWSDRILNNELELGLERSVNSGVLQSLPFEERLMVKGMIGLVQSKAVNSWAYPFDLSFREKGQLCLIPSQNLVRNIGFDTVGAHAKKGRKDVLLVSESYDVEPCSTVRVENDEAFMTALIKKRYPRKLKLFLFSMARYLAPLKAKLKV